MCCPEIGRKRVSEIKTADVLGVIVRIWHTKTETEGGKWGSVLDADQSPLISNQLGRSKNQSGEEGAATL